MLLLRSFIHRFRHGNVFRRACSNYQTDLLSRTREIFSEKEAAGFLETIKPGSIIGIDIEGHHQIQILQIRDELKNVLIFRVGFNPSLLPLLAPILENGEITKVVHQGFKDIFSLYRSGIRLWGLCDTSIAHKVYMYQAYGHSMFTKNSISYQNLCQYHGYEVSASNLLHKKNLALSLSKCHTPDHLSDDYLLYCANDVDHLMDLHLVTSSLLDPDFKSIERQLSESDILRVMDPDLGPMFSESHRSLDKNDLFISKVPAQAVNPFYIYEILEKSPGRKRIYFSPTYGTAHIIFEKRSSTIRSKFLIEKESLDILSKIQGCEAQLLIPQRIVDTDKNRSEILLDEAHISKFVCILQKATDIPIALDFNVSPHDEDIILLDVFIHSKKLIRFTLTPVVVKLLRPIFESDSITKIIFNTAINDVTKGIKLLKEHGVKTKKMIDLMTTYKLYLFSAFQANPFALNFVSRKEFFTIMGLEEQSNKNLLECTLFAYQHLTQNLIPPRILDFVGALCKLDLNIICEADESAKIVKGHFKNKLIHESFCILSTEETSDAFKDNLRKLLSPVSSSINITMNSTSIALVEFTNPHLLSNSIQLLPNHYRVLPWKKNFIHHKDNIPKVNINDILKDLSCFTKLLDTCNFDSEIEDGIVSSDGNGLEGEENISSGVFL